MLKVILKNENVIVFFSFLKNQEYILNAKYFKNYSVGDYLNSEEVL